MGASHEAKESGAMEGMMRQMVMAGPRKSRIIEVPIPKYSDDEMLVKVTLTGMCHSEWYPWATAKEGDILGHEAVRRDGNLSA